MEDLNAYIFKLVFVACVVNKFTDGIPSIPSKYHPMTAYVPDDQNWEEDPGYQHLACPVHTVAIPNLSEYKTGVCIYTRQLTKDTQFALEMTLVRVTEAINCFAWFSCTYYPMGIEHISFDSTAREKLDGAIAEAAKYLNHSSQYGFNKIIRLEEDDAPRSLSRNHYQYLGLRIVSKEVTWSIKGHLLRPYTSLSCTMQDNKSVCDISPSIKLMKISNSPASRHPVIVAGAVIMGVQTFVNHVPSKFISSIQSLILNIDEKTFYNPVTYYDNIKVYQDNHGILFSWLLHDHNYLWDKDIPPYRSEVIHFRHPNSTQHKRSIDQNSHSKNDDGIYYEGQSQVHRNSIIHHSIRRMFREIKRNLPTVMVRTDRDKRDTFNNPDGISSVSDELVNLQEISSWNNGQVSYYIAHTQELSVAGLFKEHERACRQKQALTMAFYSFRHINERPYCTMLLNSPRFLSRYRDGKIYFKRGIPILNLKVDPRKINQYGISVSFSYKNSTKSGVLHPSTGLVTDVFDEFTNSENIIPHKFLIPMMKAGSYDVISGRLTLPTDEAGLPIELDRIHFSSPFHVDLKETEFAIIDTIKPKIENSLLDDMTLMGINLNPLGMVNFHSWLHILQISGLVICFLLSVPLLCKGSTALKHLLKMR